MKVIFQQLKVLHIKQICLSLQVKVQERSCSQNGVSNGSNPSLKGMSDGEERKSHAELQKLRDTLTHRDNEISILFLNLIIIVIL